MPKKNEIKARFLSPLSYPGGKSKVASKIVAKFPQVSLSRYYEPFLGGGSVMLQTVNNRRVTPGGYYANDIDQKLIIFWKEWRRHQLDFLKNHKGDSLATLMQLDTKYRESNTDVSMATRYFLNNALSFNGLWNGTWTEQRWEQNYQPHIERLMSTYPILHYYDMKFSSLDAIEFLERELWKRCDHGSTIIYLDPPYDYNKGNVYENGDYDLVALRDWLLANKDRFTQYQVYFLMSIDNTEYVRELFSDPYFYQDNFTMPYTMTNNKADNRVSEGKELLVANYPIVPTPYEKRKYHCNVTLEGKPCQNLVNHIYYIPDERRFAYCCYKHKEFVGMTFDPYDSHWDKEGEL